MLTQDVQDGGNDNLEEEAISENKEAMIHAEGLAIFNFGCGEKTIIGTYQGDEYADDDINAIGKPAVIEVSCVKSKKVHNFGGGYKAPQETDEVNVKYHA